MVNSCLWGILKIARWAAICHSEGEVITIQNAKALYYRDTQQWCKAALREIEEVTECFHLLFYLSALHSSIKTWGSHSLKSSDTVLLFSFFSHAQLIPYHHTEWGSWLKNTLATPKNSCVCFWMVESLWLSERDLPLTCYNNMSTRMGDKGVLGRDCQQKWISAGHNTGNGSVVHNILAVIHSDNFSNTALPDFLCKIMHLSRKKERNKASTWVMKSECIPFLCQKYCSGC